MLHNPFLCARFLSGLDPLHAYVEHALCNLGVERGPTRYKCLVGVLQGLYCSVALFRVGVAVGEQGRALFAQGSRLL